MFLAPFREAKSSSQSLRPALNPKIANALPKFGLESTKMHFSRLGKCVQKLLQLCWCSWPHSPKRKRVPKASDQPQMNFPRPLNTFEPVSTNLELHAVTKPENLQMLYLTLLSKAPKCLESAFKNFFSFAGVPGPIPRSEIEFPKPPTNPRCISRCL